MYRLHINENHNSTHYGKSVFLEQFRSGLNQTSKFTKKEICVNSKR